MGGRKKLKEKFTQVAKHYNLENYFRIVGFDANPQIICTKANGDFWPELHTVFHDIVINEGVLIPWITITLSHNDKELDITIDAIEKAIKRLKPLIDNNEVEKILVGNPVQAVFRKYN